MSVVFSNCTLFHSSAGKLLLQSTARTSRVLTLIHHRNMASKIRPAARVAHQQQDVWYEHPLTLVRLTDRFQEHNQRGSRLFSDPAHREYGSRILWLQSTWFCD
jgi:hypothetical protein